MKIIEKITLAIYSIIMLIVSILTCLLIFGWIDLELINSIVSKGLANEEIANVSLVISAIFILLSIKCIFFAPTQKEEATKQGVLLENENGKLFITQETLQNIVNAVVKEYSGVESNTARIDLDKENNVRVLVNLVVWPEVVIKELSSNLQEKIKSTIKATSDLDVKEVNIRVKNIVHNKSKDKE